MKAGEKVPRRTPPVRLAKAPGRVVSVCSITPASFMAITQGVVLASRSLGQSSSSTSSVGRVR